MQLLAVVGWSGSGKTSLLEYLIPGLIAAGKTVNVLKHSHHDIILEPAHKDSARLRKVGASEVMLSSPYRYSLVHELREQQEPGLFEILARMSPADLVLVEGYKWEAIAKLEVYRPALGKPAIFREDAHICAVASDVEKPDDLSEALIWLDLNDRQAILTWLLHSLQQNKFDKIS